MVPGIFFFFIIKDIIQGKTIHLTSLLIYLTITVLWVLLYPKRIDKNIEKRMKKQIASGDNSGILGKQSITFKENEIMSTSPESEHKLTWNGIKKVVENDDYYFLYNSAISAIVIPKVEIEAHLNDLDSILIKKLNHSPLESPRIK